MPFKSPHLSQSTQIFRAITLFLCCHICGIMEIYSNLRKPLCTPMWIEHSPSSTKPLECNACVTRVLSPDIEYIIMIYHVCTILVIHPCGPSLQNHHPIKVICVWHIKFIVELSAFYNYRFADENNASYYCKTENTPLFTPFSGKMPRSQKIHLQIHNLQVLSFLIIMLLISCDWYPDCIILYHLV